MTQHYEKVKCVIYKKTKVVFRLLVGVLFKFLLKILYINYLKKNDCNAMMIEGVMLNDFNIMSHTLTLICK